MVHHRERVGAQEVDADRDEVALGLCRLLLEPDHVPGRVQLGHAEALRVCDLVEHRPGAPRSGLELAGAVGQRRTEQDVVAEHAAEGVVADEVAGEADGVGDAERAALIAVRQIQSEMLAVGEQLDDVADALAADDDHDLTDAHAGKRGDGVVDHGPVVDRQKVLVGDDGQRKEASGGSACHHETLHRGSVGIVAGRIAGSAVGPSGSAGPRPESPATIARLPINAAVG